MGDEGLIIYFSSARTRARSHVLGTRHKGDNSIDFDTLFFQLITMYCYQHCQEHKAQLLLGEQPGHFHEDKKPSTLCPKKVYCRETVANVVLSSFRHPRNRRLRKKNCGNSWRVLPGSGRVDSKRNNWHDLNEPHLSCACREDKQNMILGQ